MRLRLAATVFLLVGSALHAAEIRGKVTNAVGGEALNQVDVAVLETRISTTTSMKGEFILAHLAPGSYTLRLNAVGYRLLTTPFTLQGQNDVKEFSITLVPDNFRRTENVEVRGDVFQVSDSPATVETNLTSSEIRETSTVFADDPFRAVQSLPGVSAEGNNELNAEFSVMGAPFSNVSVYIDDVLVQNPFHEINGFGEGVSLGVLTSEVVEEMKLMPAAYPEEFGDATGAALDIHTRDGSRSGPLFLLTAGIAASEFIAEGPVGRSRRGSWLVSARDSYINYLNERGTQDSGDVGFYDGGVKLNYDLTPRQSLSFYTTAGHTSVHDPTVTDINSFRDGKSDFGLGRAGWRWSISPNLLVEARGAYLREPTDLRDPEGVIANSYDYREKVGSAGVTWSWAHDQVLEAGWSTRRIGETSASANFDTTTGLLSAYRVGGSAWRDSGYAQQASSLLKGRLHVLSGVRWDQLQGVGLRPFSPQISMALRVAAATEVQLGTGRYQQFPALEQWSNQCYLFGPMPEKSDHYTAAVEQRFGENTRLRLQAFDRQNSYSLGQVPGQFGSNPSPGDCPHDMQPLPNSVYRRDYSRGVQLVLQRRSANRLSGWLGYTLASAQTKTYALSIPFYLGPLGYMNTPYSPSPEDQRHSLSAFGVYRLRPSLNLSGRFLYGSGFPVASGTFVQVGTTYQQVGTQTLRFPYQRLDLRTDKDWAFRRWKLTLYGEVLNITNHYNARYVFSTVVSPITGQSQVQTRQGLPITPTAGLAFQF
jgi:CarboxypepD_reg-like domain